MDYKPERDSRCIIQRGSRRQNVIFGTKNYMLVRSYKGRSRCQGGCNHDKCDEEQDAHDITRCETMRCVMNKGHERHAEVKIQSIYVSIQKELQENQVNISFISHLVQKAEWIRENCDRCHCVTYRNILRKEEMKIRKQRREVARAFYSLANAIVSTRKQTTVERSCIIVLMWIIR